MLCYRGGVKYRTTGMSLLDPARMRGHGVERYFSVGAGELFPLRLRILLSRPFRFLLVVLEAYLYNRIGTWYRLYWSSHCSHAEPH